MAKPKSPTPGDEADVCTRLKVRTSVRSPLFGVGDGEPPPQKTPAASPTTFPPRRVRFFTVFRRNHLKLQTRSISPETGKEQTRQGEKVVRNAAGVLWDGGAQSSVPEGGERTNAPKKEKAPPPSSKPAKSGGGKQKKKKWSKGKQKEKVNNMVLFDQATYDKLLSEAPKFKLITPSILSDRLRINGSLARRAIKDLMARGSIRMVSAHASQQIYTRATNT
ncbi:hypothetical protein ACLB2K_068770 [Fragaria x ananassa]